MKKTALYSIAILLCCLTMSRMNAQEQQAYKIGLVGFYNLENLFDTINDPLINDEEFTPEGTN